MNTLTLPSGTTGFYNDRNQWVCTGSAMGRRDTLPASTHPKLRMQRLPFMDHCYDRGGAYWGGPANVWCAWDHAGTQLFRRADSRAEAKARIKAEFPTATFYR